MNRPTVKAVLGVLAVVALVAVMAWIGVDLTPTPPVACLPPDACPP